MTLTLKGGWIAQKTGAKFVLIMSILVGSLSLLTTPWVAHFGYIPLIACRLVMGIMHGAFWPAMFCLWSHWAPPIERSRLGSNTAFSPFITRGSVSFASRLVGISSSGAQVGNIIGFSFSSYLSIHGGWPSGFKVIRAAE